MTITSPEARVRPLPRRRYRQASGGWSALFLSPALILIVVFILVPLIMTVVISFHRWSMLTPITNMHFVGLDNYQNLLSNPTRIQALANTGIYVLLSVVITIPLAVLLAILLFFPKARGQGALRVLLFSTYVIPTIAVVIVWSNIYAPNYGPLTTMLEAVGLPSPAWLSDPNSALVSLVILNVWQMLGYYVVLLVAGLTQVPEELFEAARIDGAGPVRQTISITIPLLRQSLVFVGLMTVVNSIQVFDPIYLLTQGGPAGSTNTISFEIQRTAFQYGQAGGASALAVSLFVALAAIGLIARLVFRGRVAS